jgi:hypothetical protein
MALPPSIYQEGLRKIKKISGYHFLGVGLNPGPPSYETKVLPTRLQNSAEYGINTIDQQSGNIKVHTE